MAKTNNFADAAGYSGVSWDVFRLLPQEWPTYRIGVELALLKAGCIGNLEQIVNDIEALRPAGSFLSLDQLVQLRGALVSAFPTVKDLEMFLFDRFSCNLQAITKDGTLLSLADQIVLWSVVEGKLESLVRAALDERGGNFHLRRFAVSICFAK